MGVFIDPPSSAQVNPKELRRDTNRAIRAILQHMDNRMLVETPEELQVVQENLAIARKRSAIGLVTVGAAAGFAGRYALGKQSVPFAVSAGALIGMTYGAFSVRQKLFLDLLSVPEDQSPFSRHAHRMQVLLQQSIATAAPSTAIELEVRARRYEKFPALAYVEECV